MKKTSLFITGVAGLLLLALATPTFAAEKGKDKTVTITGEGKCGKCALHETEKCHNVIVTEKNGKKVTYFLTQNDVSKAFHDNICKEAKKVTATGTVKNEDGKKVLTVTKIELAK
ncbi:MAG: hypothetical protein HY298_24000 [Verrucomicrobia bacterium]|nr:hypothetical protein [Verrucomicrobiota bacterium]